MKSLLHSLFAHSARSPGVRREKVSAVLESHVRHCFGDRGLAFERWSSGPPGKLDLLSRLLVARIAPGSKPEEEWTYVSMGAWEFSESPTGGLEFVILAPYETPRMTELITMTVDYHRTQHLGFGHTFPIGEGWLEDSSCEYFLVSLPYPFGHDFDICHVTNDFHIHFAWLVPITKAEKDLVVSHGIEALESRFVEAGIEYSNPQRESAV